MRSDDQLAALASAGDGAAFGRLVERHQGVIRGFLRRLTRDEALADDLAQEVFLRGFRKIGQYQGPERMRGWLLGIAYREFAGHHRRQGRWARLFSRSVGESPWPAGEEVAAEPDAPRLEDRLVDVLSVTRALDRLTGPAREAVLLCDVYGFSHAEVAGLTGAPLGTVKSHVNRGRRRLLQFLEDPEG